jgi:hypothetical protein
MMKTKLNSPDEIMLGQTDYSWRSDWKVNGWLMAATLISGFSDIVFAHAVKQWPLGFRIGIVLVQFGAVALWVRSLKHWISGMDEMQRRITTSAVLFATGLTFFFVMLWHRLEVAGLFDAIFYKPKAGGSWDICTLGHSFLLLTLFYIVGYSTFNRRYK